MVYFEARHVDIGFDAFKKFQREWNSNAAKPFYVNFVKEQTLGGAPCRWEIYIQVRDKSTYDIIKELWIGYMLGYPYASGWLFDIIVDYGGYSKYIKPVVKELIKFLENEISEVSRA